MIGLVFFCIPKRIIMELLYLFIGLIAGILIGYLFALLKKSNSRSEDRHLVTKELHDATLLSVEKLETKQQSKDAEIKELTKELAVQVQINEDLTQRLKLHQQELATEKEQLRLDFMIAANKILEEKSQKFTQQNRLNIDGVLLPLQQKIKEFEQKVELFYGNDTKERATLKEQIRQLTQLNQQMNQETRNLTEALKGQSKIQGNWGEIILERILEKSGLRKDFEYFTQTNYTNENGRRQLPDMVVQLPNQRHVVIDSKMSLTAYERYSSAQDEQSVKEALKAHVASVRKHVKELSEKKYEQIHQINSLDFVLMFIPLESAFSLAIQNDHQLYYDAFDHNIIIVSPMSLLATTRTISNVWKQENQSRHAIEIAELGGKMHDKFVNFVLDLENVGHKIQAADNAYNEAMKKLSTGRGNLLTKASKLKSMGVKAAKSLPAKYNLNDES